MSCLLPTAAPSSAAAAPVVSTVSMPIHSFCVHAWLDMVRQVECETVPSCSRACHCDNVQPSIVSRCTAARCGAGAQGCHAHLPPIDGRRVGQSGCIPKCCEIQQNVSALAENRTPVWSVARTYATTIPLVRVRFVSDINFRAAGSCEVVSPRLLLPTALLLVSSSACV